MDVWGRAGRKTQVQRLWSSSGFGLFEAHPRGPCGRNRVNRGGENDEDQEVGGSGGRPGHVGICWTL